MPVYPVWLDGSLEDAGHEVSEDAVEQGIYYSTPTEVYTFTRVGTLGRVVIVASTANGIPSQELLFAKLASPAAQAAAE